LGRQNEISTAKNQTGLPHVGTMTDASEATLLSAFEGIIVKGKAAGEIAADVDAKHAPFENPEAIIADIRETFRMLR
jgi:hypothetical protein